MRFLVTVLHPLAGIAVLDPFFNVRSKTGPVVVVGNDCCGSFDTGMSGLSLDVHFTEYVLTKFRRNVDLAHISPERVQIFPTFGDRVAFRFVVELQDKGILGLRHENFFAIISLSEVRCENGIDFLFGKE